jgi:hypothetical protein
MKLNKADKFSARNKTSCSGRELVQLQSKGSKGKVSVRLSVLPELVEGIKAGAGYGTIPGS